MKYYSLLEVQEQLQKRLDIKITYVTAFYWKKRELLKSSVGGNVFTDEDINEFIRNYPNYRVEGKIRKSYRKR